MPPATALEALEASPPVPPRRRFGRRLPARVFLAHTGADTDYAARVADALGDEVDVWRMDVTGTRDAGEDIDVLVVRELGRADCFVPIVTPAYVRAVQTRSPPHVLLEAVLARLLHGRAKLAIVPVLAAWDDLPFPLREWTTLAGPRGRAPGELPSPEAVAKAIVACCRRKTWWMRAVALTVTFLTFLLGTWLVLYLRTPTLPPGIEDGDVVSTVVLEGSPVKRNWVWAKDNELGEGKTLDPSTLSITPNWRGALIQFEDDSCRKAANCLGFRCGRADVPRGAERPHMLANCEATDDHTAWRLAWCPDDGAGHLCGEEQTMGFRIWQKPCPADAAECGWTVRVAR